MKLRLTLLSATAVVSPVLALVATIGWGTACSSKSANTAVDEKGNQGEARDVEIHHEACDPAGHTAKTYKADDPLVANVHAYVTHVSDASKELCWFADLNGDGKVDVYTYFDASGTIRRREAAYASGDGIQEIATYKNGSLDVVARDTAFDGKLDTWDYYENGVLVRRERDKTSEGRVDEWWTFEGKSDQVTIVPADPRTGKPDPSQALKISLGMAPGPPPPTTPTVVPKAKPDAGPGDGAPAPSTTPPPTDAKYPDTKASSTKP